MSRALALIAAFAVAAAGCQNEDRNRYELSKDSTGRTVRLDKQTGEIAIVQGDQIAPLKSSSEVAAKRATSVADLETMKQWKSRDITPIGARAALSTSWRDGKLYYSFVLRDLSIALLVEQWVKDENRKDFPEVDKKKHQDTLAKLLTHGPYVLELQDGNGFVVKKIAVPANTMTSIVDSEGARDYYQTKNTAEMSEEDYRHVSSWTVMWY
jgi:hypothetical protein